jgi:hypothetical protein
MRPPPLADSRVRLQPVGADSVELLMTWTRDPITQGPYKRTPSLTTEQLRELFLFDQTRQYFLIQRRRDSRPLGRFYWRAWRFGGAADGIDWELNILSRRSRRARQRLRHVRATAGGRVPGDARGDQEHLRVHPGDERAGAPVLEQSGLSLTRRTGHGSVSGSRASRQLSPGSQDASRSSREVVRHRSRCRHTGGVSA